MTQPTDAEIAACIEAAKVKCVHPDAATTIDIVRAALSQWGTPTPTPAGEPWGCFVEGRVFIGQPPEHVRKLAKDAGWEIRWLYTAPPVREPLSSEQRDAIFAKLKFISDSGWELTWRMVVDKLEAAHGITKGAPHADT